MSYKLTLSSFLSLILTSTSAFALTCANDYGGNGSCASNTTAAGDCVTLGYSTDDVNGCQHYLKCPFDANYKKCVTGNEKSCAELGFTKDDKSEWCGKIITCESDPSYTSCIGKIAVCPTGELNPTCDDGYAQKQIDITEDGDACYRCVPATCEAASGGKYFSSSNYFSSSSPYLPKTENFEIFNASKNDTVSTMCYQKCAPELQLKTITKTNCPIGSWLVKYNSKYYCTDFATPKSDFSYCSAFEIQGIVAYYNGNDIYAAYLLDSIAFSNDNWSSTLYYGFCASAYNQSKKDGDFYYNYQVLMGLVESSKFSQYNCSLRPTSNKDSLLLRLHNLNTSGLKYGIPNRDALSKIFENESVMEVSQEKATGKWRFINNSWVDANRLFGIKSTKDILYIERIQKGSITPISDLPATSTNDGILVGKINGL